MGQTHPYIAAIKANDLAKVKSHLNAWLLRVDVNAVDPSDENGAPALLCAVKTGSVELVQTLLDAGGDPERANHDGWTPLMESARREDLAVVRALVAGGAVVDTEDMEGTNAFLIAAQQNNVEMLEFLLEQGAELDHYDEMWGDTALMWACFKQNPEATRFLAERGANPRITCKRHHDAEYLAKGDAATLKALREGIAAAQAN